MKVKVVTSWLLIGLATFVVIFGASQIFIPDTEALFACGNAPVVCEKTNQLCNGIGDADCWCSPVGMLFACYPWKN